MAFGQWLAGAEAPLRASLTRFAMQVDVESVLQETFLRIWQVAPRVTPDGRPDGLLRLARTTARNLALDEVRRRRARPDTAMVEDDAETEISAAAPDPFLRQTIQECREQLPGQPKRALAARIDTGGAHSDHDLAARLEMTTNTFLQNFTRARKLLAECLERHGVELGLEMP